MTYEKARVVERLLETGHTPELAFSADEYETRMAQLRSRMSRDGLDAVVIGNVSDIGYLTGYDTGVPSAYAMLVVPLDGSPFLHCAELEASAMLRNGTVKDIVLFAYHVTPEPAVGLAIAMRERGFAGKRVGIQMKLSETLGGSALDAHSYLALVDELPQTELVDCSMIVLEGRLVKSAVEVDALRTAAGYTVKGMTAGIDAVRAGARENEVAAEVYRALMSAGSENPSLDPIIFAGERTGWAPHLAFRRGAISEGDIVYFELSGTHLRYNAPMCRTVTVGPPSDLVKMMAEDSLQALDMLYENLAPGARPAEVVSSIQAKLPFRTPDYANSGTFGYSVGMAFKPCWTENPFYLNSSNQAELRAGMAFHTPIAIFLPGQAAVIFSETVLITDDGCEILTGSPERALRDVGV